MVAMIERLTKNQEFRPTPGMVLYSVWPIAAELTHPFAGFDPGVVGVLMRLVL